MSQISIERRHSMGLKRAKTAAQRVARKLKAEFELETHWRGNTLTFERPGVTGVLVVSEKTLSIEIELGVLFGVLRTRIESEITSELDALFGSD